MILESGIRTYTFSKRLWCSGSDEINILERNVQVTIDIVVDLFFLVFPLAMIYLKFKVSILPSQTLLIILPPSISLFSKLRTMLLEIFSVNMDKIIIEVHTEICTQFGRRRESVFATDRISKISKIQNRYFPRWAKILVFVSSVGYCITIIVMFIFQASLLNEVNVKCKAVLKTDAWVQTFFTKGCTLPTPYCEHAFVPNCNCAVVQVDHHNETLLPAGIVRMSNIQRLTVRNGPLRKLPAGMEQLKKLSTLDLRNNKLTEFNVDISNFLDLNRLMISFNNITLVHDSLWSHKTVTLMYLNSNVGLRFPSDSSKLFWPYLYILDISNNSVVLPTYLGKDRMPSMIYLIMSGNYFLNGLVPKSFETFKSNLRSLYIARTKLLSLPPYLAEFSKLRHMDVRDNNISYVPPKVRTWMQEKGSNSEMLFSGNKKLCLDDDEYKDLEICKPLCSKYCYSKRHRTNNICDFTCNSKPCQYDYGHCKASIYADN
jgi:Leucine-rich repeat (LRR) protein